MFRLRYTLVLTAVGLCSSAIAADSAHGTGKPPKYDVVDHDHKSREVDFGNPDHVKWLKEALETGHVHEVHMKADAPTLEKLASLRYDLGIWSLVIFLALLYVLNKVAWPRILTGLQKREANIRDALDQAERAKSEAQMLRASLQKEMDQVHDKVRAIIDEARRDAQVTADDITAKARAEMTVERERLQREIQTATDQALQSLWAKAANIAAQLSQMALKQQIDLPTHRKLIDQALQDIREAEAKAHAS